MLAHRQGSVALRAEDRWLAHRQGSVALWAEDRWLTHTGREVSPSGLKPVAYAHRQGSVALTGLQLRPGLAFGELVAKFCGQFVLLTFDRLVELLLKRWADAVLFA